MKNLVARKCVEKKFSELSSKKKPGFVFPDIQLPGERGVCNSEEATIGSLVGSPWSGSHRIFGLLALFKNIEIQRFFINIQNASDVKLYGEERHQSYSFVIVKSSCKATAIENIFYIYGRYISSFSIDSWGKMRFTCSKTEHLMEKRIWEKNFLQDRNRRLVINTDAVFKMINDTGVPKYIPLYTHFLVEKNSIKNNITGGKQLSYFEFVADKTSTSDKQGGGGYSYASCSDRFYAFHLQYILTIQLNISLQKNELFYAVEVPLFY